MVVVVDVAKGVIVVEVVIVVEDKEEEIDHRLPKMVTRPMQIKNKESNEMKAVVAVEGEIAKNVLNVSKTKTHGFTNTIICRESSMRKLSSPRTLSFLRCQPRRKDLKNPLSPISTK